MSFKTLAGGFLTAGALLLSAGAQAESVAAVPSSESGFVISGISFYTTAEGYMEYAGHSWEVEGIQVAPVKILDEGYRYCWIYGCTGEYGTGYHGMRLPYAAEIAVWENTGAYFSLDTVTLTEFIPWGGNDEYVSITGFRDGYIVQNVILTLTDGVTTPIDLGWSNVDLVMMWSGAHSDGTSLHASSFVLNGIPVVTAPVPEPGTYAMFLAGLGVLGAVARRKQLRA